jgi:CheY-like chemotaxis protein
MRRDLEVVARNGKHLTSLVNDLLDLGKIESGEIPIEKCWMSPIEQISDALQIIRSAAERKNLRIGVNYAKNIPDRIYSDPNRFHQIVLNLLTNAIKFTQKGTVRVEVKFDDELHVLITDTGIGVAPEMEDRIFEPFVRGEQSNQPGSGLGLALASDLAKVLGGRLRLVKTQLGVGSTFELTIRPEQPVEVVDESLEVSSAPVPLQKILSNKHVLVVEDDPDLQELIRRQMFQLGAIVDTCSNGAECLDHWRDEEYDIILMDIQMPIMTGDLAARQLRLRGYQGPIIAVTAHGSTGDYHLALDSGCTDYLSKPFELNTLLQVVARTLRPA